MNPSDAAKVLPPYPATLTTEGWIAVAVVAVLLISYLIDMVWVRPRRDARDAGVRQQERKEERDAFLGAIESHRTGFERVAQSIARTHEEAVTRIHARLDTVEHRANANHEAIMARLDTLHDRKAREDKMRHHAVADGDTPF